ncbi:MAG: carbon-nitrogen hydrolase family protein [Kiritimatiellia bacterium]
MPDLFDKHGGFRRLHSFTLAQNPPAPLRVTLMQNSAGSDQPANRAWLEQHLPPGLETDLIVLPEVFAFRGSDEEYRKAAEPLDGPLAQWVQAQAIRAKAWVLAGSVLERAGSKIYNTSLLFNREGKRIATYRKIHLFEARMESGLLIRESDVYQAGDHPVLIDMDSWCAGLSICYDVRFPELYRHYASQGATLLLIPANFTQRTGRDHWEVLVRARAIENQCFVLAPNQCGSNPHTHCRSHGHSLIVSPWGEVLATAADEPAVLQVTLDPAMLHTTRQRIPALKHRRADILT